MVNWRAMQAYKSIENPDASIYHMTMGSWHADLSQEGRWETGRSGSGKSTGKSKQSIARPPIEGWLGGDPSRNGCKR